MAKGIGRHVLGDHAAGGDEGARPDRHRRDQRTVGADEGAGADHRLVFGVAVVVAGDGARADIGALAHLGVAQIGEVIGLGPGGELQVLGLDEIADPRLARR